MITSPQVRFIPSNGKLWPPVDQWGVMEWTCWLSQHDGWTGDRIRNYLEFDRYHFGFGITKEKKRSSDSDIGDKSVTWLYLPTPKGVTLHASETPNTLWGGSAGGTKSHSARWEMLRSIDTTEDFRAILVRREREELKRTHMDKLEREVMRLNAAYGEFVFSMVGNPPVLTHRRTLGKCVFGHCQHPGDEEKYLSEDYDFFHGDEATRMLKTQIVGIAGRVRNDPKVGRIGRMVLTTNPGGPGHEYCVTRFITKNVPIEENARYNPNDYTYISASLYDNPYYMDPDGTYTSYENRLYEYEPERRRQLLDGDWGAVVGQYFTKFDPKFHVRKLDPREVPHTLPRLGGLQWGYFIGGIFLQAVVLPDGRIYVEREHKFSLTVAAVVGRAIVERMREAKIALSTVWANPPSDIPDDPIGEGVFETLYNAGLPVFSSDHAAVNGWQRMQHWLDPMEREGRMEPALIISPDCETLVRTLPQVVQHPTNKEDCDGPTIAAKALRYLLMSRPEPPTIAPKASGRDLSTLDERTRAEIEYLARCEASETETLSPMSMGDFWGASER